MIVAAAVLLAYKRSLEPDYPYKHLDWKDRILRELEGLRKEAVQRCYNTTQTSTERTQRSLDKEVVDEEKKEDFAFSTRSFSGNMADHHVSQNTYVSQQAQHLVPGQPCLSLDTATTFREDVRNEWIHAVFGIDFLERLQMSEVKPLSPKQGIGLAKVAPFTAYRVEIPRISPSGNDATDEKLGMSLSRLALGLYVRSVLPGSEAFCAGVQPHSILVAINGMSLLAEPSKQALERLWQYEGRVYIQQDSNSHASSEDVSTTKNGNAAKLHPEADSLSIRHPLHMTLLHQGRLYSVVLLSNPPYGIDWAPCGNFALVRKVSGHAEKAGVRKGSIIAELSSKSEEAAHTTKRDIYEIDHSLAAETIREIASIRRQEMHLTLCILPPEARSGHYERIQDMADSNQGNTTTLKKKVPRPDAVAEHEGIEVRVHPFLFSNAGSNDAPSMPPTAAGMVSSVAVSLSQVAVRVAAGELFSFPRQGMQSQRQQYYYSQKLCKSCPTLDKPLLDILRMDECMNYLLQYEKAKYDERQAFIRAPMSLHSTASDNSLVWNFFQHQSEDQLVRSLNAFPLQLLSFLKQEAKVTHGPSLMTKFVLDLFNSNEFPPMMARRLELISQSMQLENARETLETARKQRTINPQATPKRDRKPRQIPVRVESAPVFPESPSSVPPETRSNATTSTVTTSIASTGLVVDASNSNKPKKKRLFGFLRRKRGTKSSKSKSKAIPSKPKASAKPATNGVRLQPEQAQEKALIPAQTGLAKETAPRQPRFRKMIEKKANDHQKADDLSFANTLLFLKELEVVCTDIEKSLLRSFPEKIAVWALQPRSASKESELAKVTEAMRERLKHCQSLPMMNPIDSQTFLSIDAQGCYILPSAHFPLLLTFDCHTSPETHQNTLRKKSLFGIEKLYRTKVELVQLDGCLSSAEQDRHFLVHGSIGGVVLDSGKSVSMNRVSDRHSWDQGNVLTFETRSSWGSPKTLSLRISEGADNHILGSDENGTLMYEHDIGYCFVGLTSLWERLNEMREGASCVETFHADVRSPESGNQFDSHGDLIAGVEETTIQIELRVTVETVPLSSEKGHTLRSPKRSLLYKHDDDLRQEMFAIEFIKSCERVLKSCGLDLKLLTFECIPIGEKRGFIEWVHGSVPLSEICQPFAGSILDLNKRERSTTPSSSTDAEENPLSSLAKAGLTKYESLRRIHLSQTGQKTRGKDESSVNPVQDYLRSLAFHEADPYMIERSVMDTYVKSCAGYCVVTYLLGVGDRHLDNLLLHNTGHFFHCDYSFIMGNDPKKYLPLRITDDMVNGMGGKESDNYAMFLSLTCAAFLTLRRPENVRHLISMVRVMEGCDIPDLERNQTMEAAIEGLRERLRLDLSEDQAITFLEKLIEDSCSSRMWIAVDAMHSLGKRF